MSFALQELADRVRALIGHRPQVIEKKMFGGIAFMARGNMVVAPLKDGSILVRTGKDGYEDALARPGADRMRMGEREMRGFVVVAGDAIEDDEALEEWVSLAWRFAGTLPAK